MRLEDWMRLAISQAEESLREGNHGFGSVIVKENSILAAAHDEEEANHDPTSHAEMNALRAAAQALGGHLAGCTLVTTHEPCPMCASAIALTGISDVAYGCSTQKSLAMGRRRINIPCTEIFERAGAKILVHAGILHAECTMLYREDVRREITALRNAGEAELTALREDSIHRRTTWFAQAQPAAQLQSGSLLENAYHLLLMRLHVTAEDAPIVKQTETELVFHSMNFCPTLEACKILKLDTRHVCRQINEASADALVKQIDPRLHFLRNYENLRPYAEYCEEVIRLENS